MTAISTARLQLRLLTSPSSRNLGWLRDKDVVRYSEQRHREHTLSSQLKYITSFVGKSKLWGIYLKEGNQHIGNVSAMHDAPNDVADVGIMIGDTELWGRGFAAEAWKAACGFLLGGGGIRKLEAGCAGTNAAMLKIIKGSGFKPEGERPGHFLFDGAPISMVLFGRGR
jgi:RimJ/RimL family protein N-acetyltransferase